MDIIADFFFLYIGYLIKRFTVGLKGVSEIFLGENPILVGAVLE